MSFKVRKISMFSVIIPVFNKEKYLSSSIESVLGQSFSNFELLIIDDNSSDNSLQEIYKFNDKRIKVFNRQNSGSGGYAARNLGISNAGFDYVAFLDADDIWLENHLFEIKKTIEKFPESDLISSGWFLRAGKTQKIDSYSIQMKDNEPHIIKNFYASSFSGANPVCTNSVVIKKDLIVKAGMFPVSDCKKGGDIETWMRCMLYAQIAHTAKITSVYFKDIPSTVTKTVNDFQTPCVYRSVLNLINKGVEAEKEYLLKNYSNFYSRISIFRSIVFGKNKKEMLKCFFSEVDKKTYFYLKIMSFFPSFVLKPLYSIYRKIILKFSKSDLG